VYGDETKALELFERFRKCTEIYCGRLKSGADIGQLAVAA